MPVVDSVFRALVSPARRALLDRLRERDGRTLGDLGGALAMTRFGVMKHLRVLEDAGLIVTRRVGREKLHYLNPVPLRLVHDRWISRHTASRADRLVRLKRAVEESDMGRPSHVYEIYVRSHPERIWEALTRGEDTRRYFYGTRVASAWTSGSPITYAYPDGRIAAEGVILECDPPRRLVHTFSALWDESVRPDPPHRVAWAITPLGDVCRVRCEEFDFDGETATYRSTVEGLAVILNGMKTLIETGEAMPYPRAAAP